MGSKCSWAMGKKKTVRMKSSRGTISSRLQHFVLFFPLLGKKEKKKTRRKFRGRLGLSTAQDGLKTREILLARYQTTSVSLPLSGVGGRRVLAPPIKTHTCGELLEGFLSLLTRSLYVPL